ncbi:MAG: HlyC/CorC family transporter [Paludibacteraceae bacterium]|nr:HlyC/CorC family transporter [Paludibacteraceae bacterium]MBO7233516.1 HlyC/CorC family transporter [Paludibacteraceae bacterium]
MYSYILLILSLCFSAFFSGMEIAFVSSNKLRFELESKEKSITARVMRFFYKRPQQYITTMLVGNNVCLVVFSMLMAEWLEPSFRLFVQEDLLISLLQSIVATVIVLFIGEFFPKTIFRLNPNLWLNIFAPFLFVIYVLLYPVTIFATWISVGSLRLFGVKLDDKVDDITFSRSDLMYLLQESYDSQETIEDVEAEVKIFQNALDFSKIKLRDCCIPRTEIVALPDTTAVEELRTRFIETGLSKILIYTKDIDHIIGYIHSSEMFNHKEEWKKHINQVPIVPENMAAQRLMKMFMQEKKSIAVVVDEFGGTAGIVTLEDIMEEIFGDIKDEHDLREYVAKKINDNEYVLSGRLEVEKVNEQFGLDLPESDQYETIAGLILEHCGHFPKVNEVIRVRKFTFKCVKMADNRIDLVKLFC